MKNLLTISTLALILSACSGLPTKQSSSEASTPKTNAPTVDKSATEGDALPQVNLDQNLLFKLLSAEVAFQRGYNQAAYITLMNVAQQTKDPRIAKRAAEVALASRNSVEALDAVRLWVSSAPKSDEALQNYISLLSINGQYTELEQVLSDKLKNSTDTERRSLIIKSQQILSDIKDQNTTFRIISNITKPYPNLAETHIALSQTAYAMGNNIRARQEAERALELQPDSALAVLTMAQALNDPQKATQLIADFVQQYPQSDDVRLAFARELSEQKRYPEAQDQFELLLKNNPNNLAIVYALAITHLQQEHWQQAKQYLQSYLQIQSSQPNLQADPTQVQMLLSQVEEEQGNYDAALSWLNKAENNAPSQEIDLRRAQILAAQHRIPEATAVLEKLQNETDIPEEKIRYIQAESQILRENNYTDQAYDVLKAAIKTYPDNANLLYDFAMLAEMKKNYRDMETSLRKVIELDPAMQHAYNALGYSFAERNIRLPEALALITKAYNLSPNDPFITDSMGWIEYRLGNLERAEDYLHRAYALRNDPEIGVHLGEILWVRNKKTEANKIWNEVKGKAPGNKLLKETLTRLHAQ